MRAQPTFRQSCHVILDISRSPFTFNGTPGHYFDVIMGAIASQIPSLTIVCLTVYSDADKKNHQSSAPLAFVRGIHRGPVNSPHKWPVTRKMFPFDDVIMVPTITWHVWILVIHRMTHQNSPVFKRTDCSMIVNVASASSLSGRAHQILKNTSQLLHKPSLIHDKKPQLG